MGLKVKSCNFEQCLERARVYCANYGVENTPFGIACSFAFEDGVEVPYVAELNFAGRNSIVLRKSIIATLEFAPLLILKKNITNIFKEVTLTDYEIEYVFSIYCDEDEKECKEDFLLSVSRYQLKTFEDWARMYSLIEGKKKFKEKLPNFFEEVSAVFCKDYNFDTEKNLTDFLLAMDPKKVNDLLLEFIVEWVIKRNLSEEIEGLILPAASEFLPTLPGSFLNNRYSEKRRDLCKALFSAFIAHPTTTQGERLYFFRDWKQAGIESISNLLLQGMKKNVGKSFDEAWPVYFCEKYPENKMGWFFCRSSFFFKWYVLQKR